ncbi:hypothetical protein QTP88_001186 [Uroleucon formosanum]
MRSNSEECKRSMKNLETNKIGAVCPSRMIKFRSSSIKTCLKLYSIKTINGSCYILEYQVLIKWFNDCRDYRNSTIQECIVRVQAQGLVVLTV